MPTYNFTIYPEPQRKWRVRILTGQRFHRLLVIGFAGSNGKRAMWHCLCDCGNGSTVASSHLTTKKTTSCGCYAKDIHSITNTTHGMTARAEWRAFHHAKGRCQTPTDTSYGKYGGRGIEFHFESFEEFYTELGDKPTSKHSLDRINNDGHYEKGNVRWATRTEQTRNRRITYNATYNGITQSLQEWSDVLNIDWFTLRSRRDRGWCDHCLISKPVAAINRCPHK